MIGFGSPIEIELDAGRFANDEETRAVAVVVARHAERRRREYRATERPIGHGLLGGEVFWSDSVPWYEWMTEPQVLQPCAKECGIQIHELATIIGYRIQPVNWQVYVWMGMALEGQVHEKRFALAAALYGQILNDERKKKRAKASEAGRASGRARSERVRCTPEIVAKEYQILMATGTEERNVAAKLATRFNVTSNHIRKLRKQAKN
jgi:hypothetical protein